ncbi:MAG: TerB family tellurite resistance protein [Ectothiorhodospiraceae bacterium]|nr:TerB family tellurite resistance protein [Ectothiorhodospiraceae bacterium]
MIERFKQFFDKHLSPPADDENVSQDRLHLATTALLVEMTRADGSVQEEEQVAVSRAISKAFNIEESKTAELIQLAEIEISDSTCYHQFTSLINKSFSKTQKTQVVEMLWEVAYADAEMEKYEEQLLRRLSDLLYVPHAEFIQAKLRVKARLGLE